MIPFLHKEKGNKALFLLVMAALALFFSGMLLASPSAPTAKKLTSKSKRPIGQNKFNNLDYVPGEVLVKYKEGISKQQINELTSTVGIANNVQSIRPKKGDDIQLVKLKPGVSVKKAIKALKSQNSVEYAEPNYIKKLLYVPNDPDFQKQWGLQNTGQMIDDVSCKKGADINAPEGWNIEKGNTNQVTVAVIDSGIDQNHPDLSGKLWENSKEVPGNGKDDDKNDHIDDSTGYNFAGVSQWVWNYAWPLGKSDTYPMAQSIKGTGEPLTHVGLLLGKFGSPLASIVMTVRDELDGPDLAKTAISPDEVTNEPREIYKQLNRSIILEPGNIYYIVFGTTAFDGDNFYMVADNSSEAEGYEGYPDPYKDGMEHWWNGSSWDSYEGDDYYFSTNANASPRDDCGHGTHVSGIIGASANNNTGVAGVSFGARIMTLKAGCGLLLTLAAEIDAIYYAADNGAKVINMSYGAPFFSQLEQDAIDYAHDKGVVLFAAASNDGNATVYYPAGYDNVIGVGATDSFDKRWYDSETGQGSNYNTIVDISAPGQNIYSTMPTYPVGMNSYGLSADYDFLTGTSMATPMAAGLAALVLSENPALKPPEIEQLMKSNADDLGDSGRDDYFGYGRINAYNTLKAADITPPKVVGADPPNNSTGIPKDKTITITFSENIQEDAKFDNILATDAGNNPVSINKIISGKTLTLRPIDNLDDITTYKVTIPASAVKDIAGNSLLTTFIFTFTTQTGQTPMIPVIISVLATIIVVVIIFIILK